MLLRSLRNLVLMLLLLVQVGCVVTETRVTRQPFQSLRNSDWASTDDAGNRTASNRNQRGYAIQLARYTGDDAYGKVYRLITLARQEAGLANLWYSSTGSGAVVYAGRFREADSTEAKDTLKQVKAVAINGSKPFSRARIVPIASSYAATHDPRDLRSVTGRDMFTLQVGYFDQAFGRNYRKAAEDRVDELRREGEDAYYYHGPNRSMILINAWRRRDAFISTPGQSDRYSNAVLAVQERFPHNVPNGRPFTDADDPEMVRSQGSKLVRVP